MRSRVDYSKQEDRRGAFIVLDRETTANIPTAKGPSEFDFWHSPTLEELAEAQGVTPIPDVRIHFGTWPGEHDDGFEALIDELRHPGATRG
jgi:hypothetical protein